MLLWEIFSLGYMPYPGGTNQDVLYFVVEGDGWVLPGAVQGLCEYGVLSREEGPSQLWVGRTPASPQVPYHDPVLAASA